MELKSKELINGKENFQAYFKCEEKYFYLKALNNKDLIKFKFTELDMCRLKPNYNKLIKDYSHAK